MSVIMSVICRHTLLCHHLRPPQVTDMMVANSSNLIVTVKPATQRYPLTPEQHQPERGASARTSQLSRTSNQSAQSARSSDDDRDDVSLLASRSNGVLHL